MIVGQIYDIGMGCIDGTYKKPPLEKRPTQGWMTASANGRTGSFAQWPINQSLVCGELCCLAKGWSRILCSIEA